MIIKILKLTLIVLLVGIFTIGCNGILPTKIPLNELIRETLNSKGEDYNFLEDESFLEMIDEYANNIKDIDADIQYAVGNLDDSDNIPELVVFMAKDQNDMNSESELFVYKFDGQSYEILDKIDMNYDTSNHLLEIGNISEDQKGLFLSNNVGAHSTETYGFILEDGKLKNILNDNKVMLISMYPENEIKDIDNDGILEFSVYTTNPEIDKDTSENEKDMMTIWYKWDDNDSADVVTTETNNSQTESIDINKLEDVYDGIDKDEVLPRLDENLEELSVYETTHVLEDYIERLEDYLPTVNKSPMLKELNSISHSLTIDNLNSLTYMSKDKVLDDDIQQFIVDQLTLGYKLVETEDSYYFIVDNQMFMDGYESYISQEFLAYLKIKASNSNEPYLRDGSLTIDRDHLSRRIISIENFRLRFPYSSFLAELNSIYNEYVRIFILGSVNSPNYNTETNLFSDGSISVFKKALNDYPDTHFVDILSFVINELEDNGNTVSKQLKEKIEQKI